VSLIKSFIANQRGAVALEMPAVCLFMMIWLLVPLADLAIAGFQFVSARGALRNFGQYLQYNPPPDVTNTSGWESRALAKADPRFPINNLQVVVDGPIRYYSYTTTVTLSPMVLGPPVGVLCTANPCSFQLPYSERFQ
jgi:hypothetical protein